MCILVIEYFFFFLIFTFHSILYCSINHIFKIVITNNSAKYLVKENNKKYATSKVKNLIILIIPDGVLFTLISESLFNSRAYIIYRYQNLKGTIDNEF